MSEEFTVDTIKSCFKLFGDIEGFKLVEDQDGDFHIKETMTDIKMFVALESFKEFSMYPVLYPLFLQRVIRAINYSYWHNNLKYRAKIHDLTITIYHIEKHKETFYDNNKGSEATILYIIDQLESKG